MIDHGSDDVMVRGAVAMARTLRDASEPTVWLILKDVATGKLLGPSAPFWPPTRVVRAIKRDGVWVEI